MKKINRKGFTLIELLATIAIIGLVIGLSTFGIIEVVKNSKDKAKEISMDSIKKSARIYSEEASSTEWKNITNQDYKYFCVTIQELINKGLIKEKEIKNYIEKDNDKFNYVVVTKNKLTETVEKEEILEGTDTSNKVLNICTGSIVNEQVKTRPILNENANYTDEIDISFDSAEFSDESIDENGNKVTPKITGNECYYGTTSGNLNIKGEVDVSENICKIDSDNGGLKSNNTYYVQVCTITEKGSKICSIAKEYKTADFTKPIITINNNNITITYKDDNIKGEAGHYFKSSLDGTSTSNVQKCDNNFNCEETTTSITKGTWYKTNNSSAELTYQNSGTGTVTARITDRSNNYLESNKDISIYKVTFNKGTADKIDGTTSNVNKLCVAETGKTCTIKSPTIEKANYTVVGWNTNGSATTSNWNVGVEKSISSNTTYYPILRINKINIRFNTNGGTVTGETTTSSGNIYKWKDDSSGLISRTDSNGSTYST
ncbi:MAG: type II secretion system protein, partial [Bacilli bacterium]